MRVLLVEDDALLGKAVQRGLQAEGLTVDWITTGGSALTALMTHAYDTVLLDLGLPDMDGHAVLQDIRRRGWRMPVLILTARSDLSERIANLDGGADDFIIKPFDLDELAARIRVGIRRAQGRTGNTLQVGELILYPERQAVTLQGQAVSLTNREFKILQALMQAGNMTVSKDRLEQVTYGWGEEVGSNSLEVHIHNLRKKVGKQRIETVHGQGYRMGRQP
ncbi:MAG TPA: response regulator [Limnobacter sp.]|uniref:response regulator n=1 Tax=Limnobacter sp. TaxID=2003368 RepID=UPI002EDB665B